LRLLVSTDAPSDELGGALGILTLAWSGMCLIEPFSIACGIKHIKDDVTHFG
jgi:hypothetical protein